MLTEQTKLPRVALPLANLAAQLRLSSGFSDDASHEPRLEACLRAALATIESRIGKALIERAFNVRFQRPSGSRAALVFPIAPVKRIEAAQMIDRNGEASEISLALLAIDPDAHRPQLVSVSGGPPTIPMGGEISIDFTAGLSPNWDGLPADLQEATLAMAAFLYDRDHTSEASLPPLVAQLIARYRLPRLGGAGA